MKIDDRLLLMCASLRKRYLFTSDPMSFQEELLLNLVKKCAQTDFGRIHRFSSIQTSWDFLGRVMPKSYDDLKPSIEAMIDGERDVLFPGRPQCFGVTSGTYGTPKLIPLNRALLKSTRNAAFDAALLGGLRRGSMSWHHGKTLYIGPRKGRPLGHWTVYAEGTAFAYLQPFRSRFIPSYNALPEQGEEPDFTRLADAAKQYNISVIAGNPLEIVAFVKATGLVMPDVSIVFNCGYWATDLMHVYKAAFPNATVIDVYGSNEGVFGLPVSPGEFLLNYRRVFFAFLPLDNPDKQVSIAAVQLHRKYRLCVTTPGGMWNYITSDIVSFMSLRPPIVKLHGRDYRSLSLNHGGLTEDEIVRAIRRSQIRSLKYFLTFEDNRYVLYIDGDTVDAGKLDGYLGEINPVYAHLRASDTLVPLTVQQTSIMDVQHGKPVRIKKL